MMVVRRWKKVGRLRERRRRSKALRIPPGTAPKYRTELARPHCRIRLPACQVYSASHLGNAHSGSECPVVDFAARERVSISTVVTVGGITTAYTSLIWRTVFPRSARSRLSPVKLHSLSLSLSSFDVTCLHVSSNSEINLRFFNSHTTHIRHIHAAHL